MAIKFELDQDQQARFDAWFQHHWNVVHKGFHPRDMSGFACEFTFGPTVEGCNCKVECVWCPQGAPGHECNLTVDDGGELIVQYDEDWNEK